MPGGKEGRWASPIGVALPVSAKAKGTRNEHRSRRLLEAHGYRVTRAAGSMGEWDLIGMSATGVVLVQVKTDRLPSPAERQVMQDFPAPPNAVKTIHVWKPRRAAPAFSPGSKRSGKTRRETAPPSPGDC